MKIRVADNDELRADELKHVHPELPGNEQLTTRSPWRAAHRQPCMTSAFSAGSINIEPDRCIAAAPRMMKLAIREIHE
ncbi:hypothetical protein [Eoetvoesiella caeni]